mmetsp:Transcript_3767/g.9736  ORF Transcript_3767/g.9736 Transcript_3767/m.9736 type:complete len:328 (+) Transcript_3767:736-1719(+)
MADAFTIAKRLCHVAFLWAQPQLLQHDGQKVRHEGQEVVLQGCADALCCGQQILLHRVILAQEVLLRRLHHRLQDLLRVLPEDTVPDNLREQRDALEGFAQKDAVFHTVRTGSNNVLQHWHQWLIVGNEAIAHAPGNCGNAAERLPLPAGAALELSTKPLHQGLDLRLQVLQVHGITEGLEGVQAGQHHAWARVAQTAPGRNKGGQQRTSPTGTCALLRLLLCKPVHSAPGGMANPRVTGLQMRRHHLQQLMHLVSPLDEWSRLCHCGEGCHKRLPSALLTEARNSAVQCCQHLVEAVRSAHAVTKTGQSRFAKFVVVLILRTFPLL